MQSSRNHSWLSALFLSPVMRFKQGLEVLHSCHLHQAQTDTAQFAFTHSSTLTPGTCRHGTACRHSLQHAQSAAMQGRFRKGV